MTARRVTDDLLDDLAATLVGRLERISDVAWEAMGRPSGSQLIPLEERTHQGLGRLTCPQCDQPTISHTLDGRCP